MNAPVDFLLPVQQALLNKYFLHFQVYSDKNCYSEKYYINVGGRFYNDESRNHPSDGFLVYLGKKNIWTGSFYGRKFTLSTNELVQLINQYHLIKYYPENKVIRKIKEMD